MALIFHVGVEPGVLGVPNLEHNDRCLHELVVARIQQPTDPGHFSAEHLFTPPRFGYSFFDNLHQAFSPLEVFSCIVQLSAVRCCVVVPVMAAFGLVQNTIALLYLPLKLLVKPP